MAVVFARALTGPLSFTMIVLMLAATASVLMDRDPLPWLVWIAPLAVVLAVAFTINDLRSKPAEIVLVGTRAAIRSVWDVAAGSAALPEEISPPRRVREGIDVGIGLSVVTLTPGEWPDLDRLHTLLAESTPSVREDTW